MCCVGLPADWATCNDPGLAMVTNTLPSWPSGITVEVCKLRGKCNAKE